jgi:two-component system, chemotaxis family, response regulator Rcp1
MECKLADILLVEDDPADVELTRETLASAKLLTRLHVVGDGLEALAFLRREEKYANAPRPDLVLLDLNLPRMDGRTFLGEIRADDHLKAIPVVVLTTSQAEEDILRSYRLGANCYITKPVGLTEFARVVNAIEDFWFTIVRLPREKL